MNWKLATKSISCFAVIFSTVVLSPTAFAEGLFRDEYQSRETIQMPAKTERAASISGVRLRYKNTPKGVMEENKPLHFPRTNSSNSDRLSETNGQTGFLSSKDRARALLSLITLSALRGSNQR